MTHHPHPEDERQERREHQSAANLLVAFCLGLLSLYVGAAMSALLFFVWLFIGATFSRRPHMPEHEHEHDDELKVGERLHLNENVSVTLRADGGEGIWYAQDDDGETYVLNVATRQAYLLVYEYDDEEQDNA